MGADVCLLLTDVDGVFDKPPGSDGAKKIDVFFHDTGFVAGIVIRRRRRHQQQHQQHHHMRTVIGLQSTDHRVFSLQAPKAKEAGAA
jgi:glutamate 5-kinase